MDESTLGSLRRRVPIFYGQYFHEWETEMLEIFNEYQPDHEGLFPANK